MDEKLIFVLFFINPSRNSTFVGNSSIIEHHNSLYIIILRLFMGTPAETGLRSLINYLCWCWSLIE